MRLHRFLGNFDFAPLPSADQKAWANIIIRDHNIVRQIKTVLRLGRDDKIILGDEKNKEAVCQIIDIGKEAIEAKILEVSENYNEPKIDSCLFCSILKRENFELVAQKATEVGIKKIVPIISKRTVKLNFKPDRVRKIIKEAAEQCGRETVPELLPTISFKEAIEQSRKNNLNLFFDYSGELFNLVKLTSNKPKRVGAFIGPEGGWDDEEVVAALEVASQEGNFKIVSLGKLTLRAETAATIAAFILTHLKN
jgi:16S rRNA (uracil1498-N3)-methyltransferase